MGMRKYLLVCRNANHDHFLWKHIDTPHLIETCDLYSLQDLVDTHSGELPSKLHNVIEVFTKHIKKTCEICRGRGHICEICSNKEILYPFEHQLAQVCDNCSAVLHKQCFNRKNNECPRCVRIQLRKEKEIEVGEEL